MKNFKLKTIGVCLIATMLLVFGCTKDEIMSFEGENGVTFLPTATDRTFTKSYSFLGNGTGEFIEEVDVQIIGRASDKDRFFRVEVLNNDETTATENQYEILEGVVKANEYNGKLYVKLKNSDDLNTSTVSINFQLIDSEDFSAGVKETKDFTLSWTNQIIVPAWNYYRFFFVSVASPAAYRIIVESTGVRTFSLTDFRAVGNDGAIALGTRFGDYVKQWNLDNPDNPLTHDTGTLAGQLIIPRYYTKSKYD